MDTSDWIALAALMVAVAGFGVSVWAIVYSRRSAQASRDSADEATRMRELDEDRRREERERWHQEREPVLPGVIEAEYRDSPGHGPGYGALWGTISVPHAYRVRGFAVAGQSWSPLSLDSPIKPNQPIEFMIERWQPGKEMLHTDELVLRFWPPGEAEDGTAVWRCDCGRSAQETQEGHGHWERRVKVNYQQPFAG